MKKSTAAAVSAAGACLAVGMGMGMGVAPAMAGGGGGSSASLTGTGKVIGSGESAKIDATVTCPKGDTWTVGFSGFGFAEIGRDDTFARADAGQGGKCTGKEQKVKILITAYYNPPIPANCSAEYGITFDFSDGSSTTIGHAGGGGVENGPQLCLS